MNVQVITKEEVTLGGAADVQTRVIGSCSEDQQAEEPDGKSTLQVVTVRDLTGVSQLVSLVICQDSGLISTSLMSLEEPHNRLDLNQKQEKSSQIKSIAFLGAMHMMTSF